MKKTCSLNDFMKELTPWLDRDHIRKAEIDGESRMVLHFLDGTKNVYLIDDCTRDQIDEVLRDLKKKGIRVEQ